MKKKTIVLSVLIWTACSVLAGDVGRGGAAGSFLRMGAGSRTLGMGGGSAALGDDANTIYYNPAGLVYLQDRWITSSLHRMPLDRHLFFLGFAAPIGNKDERKPGMIRGGFGLGWLSAGVGNIDSRDENGVHQGMLSHAEHCFYFSFAMNPHPVLALGISGKLVYNRFPDIAMDGGAFSARGFGFDLGVLLRPVRSVSLGLTVRDLRAAYTFDSQKVYEQGLQNTHEFPVVIQTGAVWRGLKGNLIVHADYRKIESMPGTVMTGAEYNLIRGFCIRAGLDDMQPAFGFGFRGAVFSEGVVLDYAFVQDPVAPGSNHIVTCSFVF
ncbi:hypothetical protein JW948_00170 [bacterium]|nr:hypothetical protein [bacterium]